MTGYLTLSFDIDGRAALTIHTTDKSEAKTLYERLKDNPVDAAFKRHNAKRTNEANAYAWVLIDKLAEATGLTREEVYRNAIRHIGGVSTLVCVHKKDARGIMRGWEHNGIGWQAEAMPSQYPDCVNLILYSGSSVYDKAQMTRLIDSLVQDCHALDIETLSPTKLSGLLERWNESTRTL